MSYPQSLAASAQVTAATGAIAAAFNVTSALNNGAGDVTVTLSEAIDATEMTCSVTVSGATPGIVACEKVSDGVLRVRTLNAAGAATNLNFDLQVFRTKVG